MQIHPTDDFAHEGAELIAAFIRANPEAAIVVPTGNTPMEIYRVLAGRYREGAFDTSRLRVFQLDAYQGIAPNDRRALFRWMWESFCEPLGIPAANVVRLPGDAADPELACRAYEETVRAIGGFDLAILGLGLNGHLGFNEPPAPANAPTRLVQLSEASLNSNAIYWGGREHVPTHALTCGMDLLLAAKQTLLLVSGERKRDILRRTLEGPVTPNVPASFLRQAANVTVLADHAALGDDMHVGQ